MNYRLKTVVITLATTACLNAGRAVAEEVTASGPTLNLSGYGTFGYVRTDTNLAEYSNSGQPKGADKGGSFSVDSRLGVQATAIFDSTFSTTIQALSRYNGEGNWKPSIEWAFVRANLGQGFGLRVGRMGTPYFQLSDYRNVGYASLWSRPPQESYDHNPFSSHDGFDLLWQGEVRGVLLNTQVYAGRSKVILGNNPFRLDKIRGINATAEIGPLTLRAGYAVAKFGYEVPEVNQLVEGLRALGEIPLPEFTGMTSLANELIPKNKNASFSGVGMSLDWKNMIVIAEYTRRMIDTVSPDTLGWYTTFGYRLGSVTPYVTFSEKRQTSARTTNIIPSQDAVSFYGLPPQVVGALPSLQAGVETVLSEQAHKTTALGLRWDIRRNVALKMQHEWIRLRDSQAIGLFSNQKPGFVDKTYNVTTIVVDFVF